MRTFIIAASVTFALGGSALANNIALSSLGAIATSNISNSYSTCPGYCATNAIDGSTDLTGGTQWDAVGYAVTPDNPIEPYLLITLPQAYTIDSVSVTGMGSDTLSTSFNIYVGTGWNPDNNTLIGATEVLEVTNQPDGGSGWTISTDAPGPNATAFTLPTGSIQYVEYVATGTPGANGQDAAFANEISVDDPPTPEPATIGLAGLALLALGFGSRFRKIVL